MIDKKPKITPEEMLKQVSTIEKLWYSSHMDHAQRILDCEIGLVLLTAKLDTLKKDKK